MPTPVRRTLGANGAFSLTSGTVLTAAAAPLGTAFDAPTGVLAAAGLGVVVFGALLLTAARRRPARAVLRFAFVADAAWVVGAAVLAVASPGALNGPGWGALASVTAVVAAFAVLQGRLLRETPAGR